LHDRGHVKTEENPQVSEGRGRRGVTESCGRLQDPPGVARKGSTPEEGGDQQRERAKCDRGRHYTIPLIRARHGIQHGRTSRELSAVRVSTVAEIGTQYKRTPRKHSVTRRTYSPLAFIRQG